MRNFCLLITLLKDKALNVTEISFALRKKEEEVLINLRYLLSEEKIEQNKLNKFYLK